MMRPFFRIVAGILGAAFLIMGALNVVSNLLSAKTLSNAEWRGPLFLLGWGVIFVAIGARGYMKR
ncbi:MAG TPA: hypothetical protein VGH16_12660 [Candidatus Binatia bacterium]|jgi:hypothetical protein